MIEIVCATLIASIGSLWIATGVFGSGHLLSRKPPALDDLVSLAVGALLAVVFIHLLPEAFRSQASARDLFAALLAAVVFFFLVDRTRPWQDRLKSRRHEECRNAQRTETLPSVSNTCCELEATGAHARVESLALVGAIHSFCAGIIVASAFAADERLGWITVFALLAHRVPQHLDALRAVRNKVAGRGPVIFHASLSAVLTLLGALAGMELVSHFNYMVPFMLSAASGSFIFVALTDLMPRLQQRLDARGTFTQLAWLSAGIGCVTALSLVVYRH